MTRLLTFTFTFAFLLLLFTRPQAIFAHSPSQEPFFQINGEFTDYYPVPGTSILNLELPHDIATGDYLINEPISFVILTDKLEVDPQVLANSTFKWNFGDESPVVTGTKLTHIYNKAGSFVISIDVSTTEHPEGEELQTTMIHIKPRADYQLPQAIPSIDGDFVNDPLVESLDKPKNIELKFDPSNSKSSEPITEYFWDFGDGQSSTEKLPSHKYTVEFSPVLPFLRIKDANGFISDQFVEVNLGISAKKSDEPLSSRTPSLLLLAAVSILIGGTVLLLIFKPGNPRH